MNVSFTSQYGVEVLRNANRAATLAQEAVKAGLSKDSPQANQILDRLNSASIGTDVLVKTAPVEDNGAEGFSALNQRISCENGGICNGDNPVDALAKALSGLNESLSKAVKMDTTLDGEDRTIGSAVGGTIRYIKSVLSNSVN